MSEATKRPEDGIVVDGKQGHQSSRHMAVSKKQIILVLLILLLAVALVGTVLFISHHRTKKSPLVQLKSEQQIVQQELADALAHPPASGASVAAKTAYYDKLIRIQEDLSDYAGATKTFETRIGVSTKGLDYNAYYLAAMDACKAGDKTVARSALAQGRKILPLQDNPDVGYVRQTALEGFNGLARNCGI